MLDRLLGVGTLDGSLAEEVSSFEYMPTVTGIKNGMIRLRYKQAV